MPSKDNQPTIPADMIPEQSVASPAKPEDIIDAATNDNSKEAPPKDPDEPKKPDLLSDSGGQPHLADFRKQLNDFFNKQLNDEHDELMEKFRSNQKNNKKHSTETQNNENNTDDGDNQQDTVDEIETSDNLPTPTPGSGHSEALDGENENNTDYIDGDNQQDTVDEIETLDNLPTPTPESSQSKAFDGEIGDTRARQQEATAASNEKKAEAMDSAMPSMETPPQSMAGLNTQAANGMGSENLDQATQSSSTAGNSGKLGELGEIAEEAGPLLLL